METDKTIVAIIDIMALSVAKAVLSVLTFGILLLSPADVTVQTSNALYLQM